MHRQQVADQRGEQTNSRDATTFEAVSPDARPQRGEREAEEIGGRFCEDCHGAELDEGPGLDGGVKSYALDAERAKALWAKSEAMVGETFPVEARAEGGRAGTGANWFVRFFTLTPGPATLLAPDDRGRFVSIVDSRLLLVPRARRVELGRDRVRAAHWALRRVGLIPRLLVALLPMGIAGIAAVAAANQYRERDVTSALLLLIPFGFCLTMGVGLLLSHSFYSPRRAARVMVAHDLCASCARVLG